MKEKERLLSIEEVAVQIGCSYKTLCNWYAFKRKYPENEWAKKLPEYTLGGTNVTKRLWKQNDIAQLIEFKNSIPKGRNGVLGSVTQKWYHKNKEKKNE